MKPYLLFLALALGCSPVAHSVPPITESHSQLTATDYDAAETAFSGGLAPMPQELADARCQMLLERRDTASAVVLGLVGLTGGAGLGTLIPKDATEDEQRRWDIGLGAAALAAATTATILGALVRSWSAEYERECISETEGEMEGETPAPAEHPASDEIDPDGGV